MQQGDIRLFNTYDGGDIAVTNGIVEMSGGVETAAYLSLFGGNEDDDGREDSAHNWWGNLAENETDKTYRSETQHLIQALPLTSNNLKRIEDAAKKDLQWFISTGVATSINVFASVPALNTLELVISIDQKEFKFIENWRAK